MRQIKTYETNFLAN